MNPEVKYPTQEAVPDPTPRGFLDRLIGLYFSPGETFQEIGRAPSVLLPIIVLILLTGGVVYLMTVRIPIEKLTDQQATDQRIERAVESGSMTREQADRQKEATQKFLPVIKVAFPFIAIVGSIIVLLIIAGVAKLASMIVGVENSFKQLFVVTIFAFMVVSIVSSVLLIILIFVKSPDDFDPQNALGSNLAALISLLNLGDLPKFLKTLLSYVDVFYIWRVILLGIGFAAVSKKLKTSTALTWVIAIAFLIALIHASASAVFG